MSVIYQTQASVVGGREGLAKVKDSPLEITMVAPGGNKPGNNPEQLFAMGYAACFDGALSLVKRRAKANFDSETQVSVQLNNNGDADFSLSVQIHVIARNAQVSTAELEDLVAQAHQVCPYSKATRGNIDVSVSSEIAG